MNWQLKGFEGDYPEAKKMDIFNQPVEEVPVEDAETFFKEMDEKVNGLQKTTVTVNAFIEWYRTTRKEYIRSQKKTQ